VAQGTSNSCNVNDSEQEDNIIDNGDEISNSYLPKSRSLLSNQHIPYANEGYVFADRQCVNMQHEPSSNTTESIIYPSEVDFFNGVGINVSMLLNQQFNLNQNNSYFNYANYCREIEHSQLIADPINEIINMNTSFDQTALPRNVIVDNHQMNISDTSNNNDTIISNNHTTNMDNSNNNINLFSLSKDSHLIHVTTTANDNNIRDNIITSSSSSSSSNIPLVHLLNALPNNDLSSESNSEQYSPNSSSCYQRDKSSRFEEVEVEPRTEVSHFPESDNEMQVEINN
jgi:hypothetical protein